MRSILPLLCLLASAVPAAAQPDVEKITVNVRHSSPAITRWVIKEVELEPPIGVVRMIVLVGPDDGLKRLSLEFNGKTIDVDDPVVRSLRDDIASQGIYLRNGWEKLSNQYVRTIEVVIPYLNRAPKSDESDNCSLSLLFVSVRQDGSQAILPLP